MKVFNEAAEAINPGGLRRRVNMAVLRIDPPGILEFINAKDCEGSLVYLNISVVINDKSMTRKLQVSFG
jgi:ribonucleotide reductase alpha subunit